MSSTTRRRSRIPSSRIERFARIAWMAGEAAAGGVGETLRRWGPERPGLADALLTASNAQRLARRLAGLRGAAMKLGQLVSLEGDDFLPPEVSEAFAILRADADAMPKSQLRRVLGRNLGAGWQERFRHFDLEPIAAASIGQVHAAEALDGRALALKVQYPGVARGIESDVDNLASVLRLSRLLPGDVDVRGIVREAKRQLRQEADYRAEAWNLSRYRKLLQGDPEFVVPAVHPEFSTGHVLAMDRLRGRPLEDLACPGTPAAVRDRAGTRLYRLLFREIFEFGFVQTDPNCANYLQLDEPDALGLLDLGSARALRPELVDRYRAIFRAGVDRDREAMRRAALDVGFVAPEERADRIDGVVDLLLLGTEAFAAPGAYDFGASDLAARIRAAGLDLAFRRGFWTPPPAETLFLHRKLAGTFLLCARLGARVHARALVEPWLKAAIPMAQPA